MQDLNGLRPWATPRQLEYIDAIESAGGYRAAAKQLGVGHSGISESMKRLRRRAAKQGYAPEHDMIHTAPDSHIVKGVSTFYDEDGKPVRQWVKTDLKKEAQQEALMAFVNGLAENLPRYEPILAPAITSDELMSCYIIGDHHLGMLTSAKVGGGNWDIETAKRVLIGAVRRLVSSAGGSTIALLCNLGDFLHANGEAPVTQSGNILDVDGHFSEAFEAAAWVIRQIIDLMLEYHNHVVIMNAKGNHDRDSALMLNVLLKACYENEPRVEVLDNVRKLVTYSFGKNLIAAHHGDKMKPQQMYEQITRDYSAEWGSSEFRFGWMGHIHHQTSKEIGGMHFSSWGVLPPTDKWHADSGYGSDRSMSCVMLHKDYGEHMRFRVGIKEIESLIK